MPDRPSDHCVNAGRQRVSGRLRANSMVTERVWVDSALPGFSDGAAHAFGLSKPQDGPN